MNITSILPLLALFFILAACTSNTTSVEQPEENPDPQSPSVTTITVGNMGATAYVFIGIDGEGADAPLNEENAEIELTVGERFTFNNDAGASSHPLDFSNSDRDKLFGQSNAGGLFDEDDTVDLVKDGNSISFTLTAELASALNDYVCSFHPGMNGGILAIE